MLLPPFSPPAAHFAYDAAAITLYIHACCLLCRYATLPLPLMRMPPMLKSAAHAVAAFATPRYADFSPYFFAYLAAFYALCHAMPPSFFAMFYATMSLRHAVLRLTIRRFFIRFAAIDGARLHIFFRCATFAAYAATFQRVFAYAFDASCCYGAYNVTMLVYAMPRLL